MNRQSGFTLIELMVSVAIIGILMATAIPAYNTYRERARGAEAITVVRQVLDAQIAYYLENDEFYPPLSGVPSFFIANNTLETDANIQGIFNNLNIQIKTGRLLEYTFTNDLNNKFMLFVNSASGLNIYKGSPQIVAWVTSHGEMEVVTP